MKYDLEKAHKFSCNNMPELKKDKLCGCFHCLTMFDPADIEDWIILPCECDRLGTAVCPYCGIDSVIGSYSGFPITIDFLEAMYKKFFA
ncbi:MAG: cytoplasmic protein [Clostridiaceae bacterium]|nr:cytoplasmic protein [Clostridiaceae bacterium]